MDTEVYVPVEAGVKVAGQAMAYGAARDIGAEAQAGVAGVVDDRRGVGVVKGEDGLADSGDGGKGVREGHQDRCARKVVAAAGRQRCQVQAGTLDEQRARSRCIASRHGTSTTSTAS